MMEDDPKKLWDSLKERYNQQQGVILPEARHEWSLSVSWISNML
jgi:hypothetical protein